MTAVLLLLFVVILVAVMHKKWRAKKKKREQARTLTPKILTYTPPQFHSVAQIPPPSYAEALKL